MKKILLLLLTTFFIVSCGPNKRRYYNATIVYTLNDMITDTLTVINLRTNCTAHLVYSLNSNNNRNTLTIQADMEQIKNWGETYVVYDGPMSVKVNSFEYKLVKEFEE